TVTYTVTVKAGVTSGMADGDWTCTTPPTAGHGFFNTATITANGQDATKTACAEPVKPTVEKTFDSADQSGTSRWAGTWDVTSTATLRNESPATPLVYALSDPQEFPADVTLNSASATRTGHGSAGPWTAAPFGLASDRALAARDMD